MTELISRSIPLEVRKGLIYKQLKDKEKAVWKTKKAF